VSVAHFLMTVSGETGRIIGVGIYSDDTITTAGRVFTVSPGNLWTAAGDSYHEAQGRLRGLLREGASWIAKPGSPLHVAIIAVADGGRGVAVEWPEAGS